MSSNSLYDFTMPKIDISEIRNYHLADYQYEVIIDAIKDFEKDLSDNEEVALMLTNFGQSVVMVVTDIGYSNPSIIHYYGYVNGQYSHLIQHVSQINFLLTSSPKADPSRPARRIGFTTSNEIASTSDTDN